VLRTIHRPATPGNASPAPPHSTSHDAAQQPDRHTGRQDFYVNIDASNGPEIFET
jgi:hypothetical protein